MYPVAPARKRALCIERFFVHRENQDRNSNRKRSNAFDQFQSARSFQGDINDHEIRSQPPDQLDRLLRGFGFPADLHIQFVIDQLRQAVAKQRMIIDNDNSFLLFSHG